MTTDSKPTGGRPPRRSLLALGLLLALLAYLLASSIASVRYHGQADEGYYRSYAEHLSHAGLGGFRELFDEFLADETVQIFPHPLRIGYLGAAALWVALWGATFPALSWLSLVSHLATTALNYLFARRHFGERRALLIAALTGFSSLGLALGRRALMDSFATLTATLAVWLFLELQVRPSRRNQLAFAAAFLFAQITRETALFLALPWIAFTVLAARQGSSLEPRQAAWLLGGPVAGCGLLYVLVAGGVEPVAELARILLGLSSTAAYALAYGSGPWYRYLIDFLLLSPGPTLLALGYLGVLLARLRRGEAAAAEVYFAILVAGQLLVYGLFTKNVRYLALLNLPLCIFAVMMLDQLNPIRDPEWRNKVRLAAAAALCWLEYQSFYQLFVLGEIYDPTTYFLAAARRIIPGG
jgi:Dolichyl-phosphate-mannose-protein mannosyltransferase